MALVEIETKGEKALRMAKITKYGKCDKHNGHWDGDWWFGGFVTVLAPAMICMLFMSNVIDNRNSKISVLRESNNVYSEQLREYSTANNTWQTEYDRLQASKTKKPKGVHYRCTNKDGTVADGLGKETVTLPESAVATTKECIFNIQY